MKLRGAQTSRVDAIEVVDVRCQEVIEAAADWDGRLSPMSIVQAEELSCFERKGHAVHNLL